MNILFLSEQFYPYGGGAELATYLYARLLGEANFHVIVVTNSFSGKSEASKNGNTIVYKLPLFGGSNPVKYPMLTRFDTLLSAPIRKALEWADVVYIPRFWYSAIPFAKLYKKPVLVHLHDYIAICPLANLYNLSTDSICHNRNMCSKGCIYLYERIAGRKMAKTLVSMLLNSTLGHFLGRLIKTSDAIVCVSEAQKDVLGKYDASFETKAHVIYNPLPELSFMKIKGDGFGYFGGPNYLKGYNVLRQAIALLASQKANSMKIHATSFPREQQSTIADNLEVSFYKRLNTKQIERLYTQLKAVIFPSICPEPLPYVVSEALLRGRVVIASHVGGVPEQVKACNGVFLYDARNHQDLAEAMDKVNSLSRETMADLGLHNRETFAKNFDNEKTARNFVSLCTTLC